MIKNPEAPVIYKDDPTGTMMCDDTVFLVQKRYKPQCLFRSGRCVCTFGTYTARAYDKYGCYSEHSEPYTRTAGFEEIVESGFKYYPNPSDGTIYLEDPSLQIVQMQLYDLNGSEVSMNYHSNGNQYVIQWDSPASVLILRIVTKDDVQYIRIVTIH